MMNTLKRLFTEHANSVNETYFQHLCKAMSFAGSLFVATICAAIHAIFPFIFEKTSSRIITKLYDRMVTNRTVRPAKHEDKKNASVQHIS